MAEIMTQHEMDENDFRKKRQWTSFKAQVYTALSTATFFSVLTTLVTSAVKAVAFSSSTASTAVALSSGAASAAVATTEMLMFGVAPVALMGAAIAVGVGFTYMAQHEWTDLKVMEDDHLAKRNAECMHVSQDVEKPHGMEHEQNCRADGKQWAQVVHAPRSGPEKSAAIH